MTNWLENGTELGSPIDCPGEPSSSFLSGLSFPLGCSIVLA